MGYPWVLGISGSLVSIWRMYHCHFVRFCMTFWIYIHVHVRKRNEKWILRLCNFLIKKNARKISTFLYYRTSETNCRVDFLGGVGGRTWHWTLSFCELFFLPNLQLNIGKKYLKTAIIIDESLILAIVSHNYSTKPSYIFQLKRDLKVWKYIFNLFHFEVLIQNRNPKFRSLSLFWLFMNIRPVCVWFSVGL